ncbi:hypothetical protein IP84_13995, partial [beta proteobacterium AAP99]
SASQKHILLEAKEHITLVTEGGGYITLKGGNVEIGLPGAFTPKASKHAWEGAGHASVNLQAFQEGKPQDFKLDHRYHDGEGVSGAEYEAVLPDGSIKKGKLGADGKATLSGIAAAALTVRFGPDSRDYGAKDKTPTPDHDPTPSDAKLDALVDKYAAKLKGVK